MHNQTAKGTVRAVTPAFDQAQAQIDKEINAWYGRFAKNNNISMLEAKRLLNTRELKEFRWDVEEYIRYGRQNAIDQQWMKELENASSRFHINRLEALKVRTQNTAERAFGNELDQLDDMAARVYMDGYYHTAYEIQRGLGIGFDVSQIDDRKLQNILSKPWTADNMTFSDRVWKSRTQMIDALHTELTRTCILGKAPDEAIEHMTRFVDGKVKNAKVAAGRLVMTEAAYFGSAAQKDCFNDLDVEFFEIIATLDNKTSEVCQDMDGKHFPMSEYEIGVTAPPFHVWCRSCTAPWFEDDDDSMRAARDEDGQTYYVPASMKYDDWKQCFVDKTKDPADFLKPATVEDIVEAAKKFTDEEVRGALEWYASGEGMWVNKYLRDPDSFGSITEDERKMIEMIQQGTMSQTVKQKTLYRSVDAEAVFGKMSQTDYDNIRDALIYNDNGKSAIAAKKKYVDGIEGKVITEKGFLSTTKDQDFALDFGDFTGSDKPIVLELNVPDGIHGFDMKPFEIEGDEQFEVLLSKGHKYKITEVGVRSGEYGKSIYVKADILPEEISDVIAEEIEEVKKAIKLEPDMFPSSFTATNAEAKNTQAVIDYVNAREGADPAVVELYSKMGKMENIESQGIEWAVKHNKNSEVRYWWNRKGELAKAHISYPKLTLDNPTGQVNTTLHEQMHLMDMYLRKNKNGSGWFSSCDGKLKQFFRNIDVNDVKMSPKVKKLFSDFKDEYNTFTTNIFKTKREEYNKLRDLYRTNSIDFKEYKKRMNEIDKLADTLESWGSRDVCGGGVDCFQDIYDALSGGTFRDKGVVMYGHGKNYYNSFDNRCSETLANYGALSITRPELIDFLREDYPELVDMLDDMVQNMLKKVGD